MFDLLREFPFLGQPATPESLGIPLEGQIPFHDLHPLARIPNPADIHRQREAVEQFGAQVSLLGVHRPHQDKAGGMGKGDALALDDVHAHSRRIKQ